MAKAESESLLTILKTEDEQFVIPIYQRKYDWDKENVQKLLDDLDEFACELASTADDDAKYYMGNVVTKRLPSDEVHRTIKRHAIVDGQQRLTTTMLIVAKLNHMVKEHPKWADDVPNLSGYLKTSANARSSASEKMKIDRLDDGAVLDCIIHNKSMSEEQKDSNIYLRYDQISKYLDRDLERAKRTYVAIRETLLIRVLLGKTENENKIFEAINSDGKPLDIADLIKNHIFFYEHTFNDQAETADYLNNEYQQRIELSIGRDKLDDFYRHYCCVRSTNKQLLKRKSKKIYTIFKVIAGEEVKNLDGVKELIGNIAEVAKIWNDVHKAPTNSIDKDYPDEKLWVFSSIVLKSINSFFPMVVEMFQQFNKQNDPKISKDIYRIIARVILFGCLSGLPEKNKTRDIPAAVKRYLADKSSKASLQDFEKWLEVSDSAFRIPTKNEMISYAKRENIYKGDTGKYLPYLLLANELLVSGFDTKKTNFNHLPTIEHIVPQKYFENPEKDPERARAIVSRIDALGNLTLLTGKQNSKLGNSTWSVKKAAFENDSFTSNRELAQNKEWNLDTIDKRTSEIVENLVEFFR